MARRRTLLRTVAVLLLLVAAGIVGFGYVKWTAIDGGGDVVASGAEPVAPANGTTVVTTSKQVNNYVVAYAPDGSVLYHDDRYLVYNDVDPSPAGTDTVTYVATEGLDREECDATEPCNRNVLERVNLSTGERERLFSWVTARSEDHWHDVDRLGPDRWLVADIARDRAFVIDTTTGVVTWSWNAQAAFPLRGGGIFPGDWTHLNDVERLPDGRVMVSLRNQDQVVFVDPEDGYQANWTLGADGDHSILHEQHNPDYIPEARGGPAVVVADSENNRVVEYQRRDGGWERTWQWSDVRLMWPRDADRLPNGNTLVTDTNGGRVVEVTPGGEVAWEVQIDGPYEAERLETGDESAGGPSATRGDLRSRHLADGGDARRYPLWEQVVDDVVEVWVGLLPPALVNPLLYVLPPWVGVVELGGLVLFVATLLGWAAGELYLSPYRLEVSVSRE